MMKLRDGVWTEKAERRRENTSQITSLSCGPIVGDCCVSHDSGKGGGGQGIVERGLYLSLLRSIHLNDCAHTSH